MIVVEWFLKGGIFMWPILLGSLIGCAIIADRLRAHWRARLDYKDFIKYLKQELAGCPLRSPSWLSGSGSPVARIADVYLRYIRAPVSVRNEALKREGNRYLAELDSHMKLLSSIAHVSPLLGLLGTVAGLVAAFYQIELNSGHVNPTDLAGGIWEALLTTVAGLMVGIPTLLMHQFFHSRIEKIAREMQETISELDEMLAVGKIQIGTGTSVDDPFKVKTDEVAKANETYEVL
jgi:biopolymer transport protein ExbB